MIPGAIHIPLGLIEFKMNELDKKKSMSWYAVLVRAVVAQRHISKDKDMT